ncbi:DNA polymerase III subunit beta [Microbispora triticiradicis]|uniref:DNA polymerase III subunit beta n=1 Tax=Microbispora triticiradicis TaxID=2200763 RepID=UPI001AD77EFD|nr:DNA polymerase III subunit beta [Microbispora triticiradicis]MBO4273116.1 DNA polymerase III subunit beta [Microbispora triticiradicis]
MKITVDAQTLAEAVAWTARVLPHRPSMPVLAGLHLEAADDTVTLSAFDYDVSARASISADVAEPGTVVLPGKVLAEITRALPARRTAELALSGAEVTLTCGTAEFGLLTLPVDDYPALPEPPQAVGTLDAAQLRRLVEQMAPCTSRDNTLPMLTGIRFDLTTDGATAAATDRYLMASRTISWQPTVDDPQIGLLVPAEPLQGLSKGLSAGQVELGVNDKLAAFTTGGRTTTMRLLDPQFVDYASRIGVDMPVSATVDKAELIAAVKRVSLVAERNTAVRLTFTECEVLVQAGGGDVGRGADTVAGTLEGAETFHIAFAPNFMLTALEGVDEDRARIIMQAANMPAIFTGADAEPGAYRCLAMSLRLA